MIACDSYGRSKAEMFFPYPIAATEDNWLHEGVCSMLGFIHECAAQAAKPPTWADLIKKSGCTKLMGKTGLRDRVATYQSAFLKLKEPERRQVMQSLNEQNAIPELLSGESNCTTLDELPESIREPIKDIFVFAYGLLTDLGVRDDMYSRIYESIPDKLCPFCGCERFDFPTAKREALDHYLAKSIYPCAAANLKNLVPMGNKCNSKYKLSQNIIVDNGVRRKAHYPYDCIGVKISLDPSVPFGGIKDQVPQWKLEFNPGSQEVKTWNDVFEIMVRFIRDELNPSYNTFLREFRNWCKASKRIPDSIVELRSGLEDYAKNMDENGLADRAFLKAAVFRMLHLHCSRGDTRLSEFLLNVVRL